MNQVQMSMTMWGTLKLDTPASAIEDFSEYLGSIPWSLNELTVLPNGKLSLGLAGFLSQATFSKFNSTLTTFLNKWSVGEVTAHVRYGEEGNDYKVVVESFNQPDPLSERVRVLEEKVERLLRNVA